MSTLYRRIAGQYLDAIRAGTLRAGDRFPSVRQLMRTHEVSLATALQACRQLEDEGWLEARARSGYFVRHPRRTALPPADEHRERAIDPAAYVGISAHVSQILARGQRQPTAVNLALAVAPPALYPGEALARIMQRKLRLAPDLLTTMTRRHGHPLLRAALARRALERGIPAAPEEIVITQGCTEAVNLALRAVTQPGDTVALESPTFYGLLQIAEALGLRAIELPTSPRDGLSVEALQFALDSDPTIRAVVTMPSLHNPLGCTMPDERKAALVSLCGARGVALIEDDIYGEMAHDSQRPRVAKAWDRTGHVLLCSSFSKTIAPGLRVGWIVPGRWRREVERLKYGSTMATALLPQRALADYLASGRWERHLNRVNRLYAEQMERMQTAIARHFPAGTRCTRPAGGFILWLELPEDIDALALQARALTAGISIAPGPLFSPQGKYRNCVRLMCAVRWDAGVDAALATLGSLASSAR